MVSWGGTSIGRRESNAYHNLGCFIEHLREETSVIQKLLSIAWRLEEEIVPVPGGIAIGEMLDTFGIWKKPRIRVSYLARSEQFEMAGSRGKLVLRYRRDEQTDSQLEDFPDTRWGTSVINWDVTKGTGIAEWRDEEQNSEFNGTVDVTVLGGENPITEFRGTVSALIKPRPEQQKLRDHLFCLDRSCVLTGESLEAAVEAAHVVPVKAGGRETISNAFLLRADLHRLFDAGYFWFELTETEAVVRYKQLSARYCDTLASKRLPSLAFERVKKALQLRAELSNSKGKPD
jgi:hypothetical protein